MAKNPSRHKSPRRAARKAPEAAARLPQSDATKKPFTPEILDKTVIAMPLLRMLEQERGDREKIHPIIIDLNGDYPDGMPAARNWVVAETEKIVKDIGINKDPKSQGINLVKSQLTQYLFARLEGEVIRELVRRDGAPKTQLKNKKSGAGTFARAIYHIWPDFKIRVLVYKSISTIKVDAAHSSFSAFGEGIVWAVLDSGIDAKHPHFALHHNLDLAPPLVHTDFTGTGDATADKLGHGTHVAGIIAGEITTRNSSGGHQGAIRAFQRSRDENGEITYDPVTLEAISGMAPRCKLLSFQVVDENGDGEVSTVLSALAKIQEINGYGRRLLIHGVNMSIGYDFDPEWYACGQSPLCVEVDRLVRSGVAVVVAAGNNGYGSIKTDQQGTVHAPIDMTIADPGNAALAITVGSTHREMPHIYGVSYFSSKGPTGDGRLKPDLVAPGEKILSCAAGQARSKMKKQAGDCDYLEDSGTSMSAPHVSGAIAGLLSIRREFIGEPERVKEILL
jgi:serine protease AprX